MKIYDFNGKKNIFDKRIKNARKNRKLSQAQLTARLQVMGITIESDSISRIEIGTRFVCDYEIMAPSETLKVTLLYLLGIKNNL